ncbi:hypothetical protein BJ912DRAFT_37152 [Pholiota molesta]|nr:hypothetical protein BJ912DRAFT_37152 [Pholiota molesta]
MLSLASSGRNAHWKDLRAIPELYSVLQSTPGITTLYLEGNFLSLCTQSTPALLSALGDAVAPLWHHAPHLATLQIRLGVVDIGFEGIATTIEEAVELFVCNLFLSDGGWLDLQNPACPIKSLMVNDGQIRDFMRASIWENVDGVPRVAVRSFEQWWAKRVAATCAIDGMRAFEIFILYVMTCIRLRGAKNRPVPYRNGHAHVNVRPISV